MQVGQVDASSIDHLPANLKEGKNDKEEKKGKVYTCRVERCAVA